MAKVPCLRSRGSHTGFLQPGRLVASRVRAMQGQARDEAAPRGLLGAAGIDFHVVARAKGPRLCSDCRSAACIRGGSNRGAVDRPSSSAAPHKSPTQA